MGFNVKNVWRLETEKINHTSSLNQTTPLNTRPLNATIEDGLLNQEEIIWRKIGKKSIHVKFVGILQD